MWQIKTGTGNQGYLRDSSRVNPPPYGYPSFYCVRGSVKPYNFIHIHTDLCTCIIPPVILYENGC